MYVPLEVVSPKVTEALRRNRRATSNGTTSYGMETFLQDNIWLFIISVLWVLPWKGYALWTASKNHNKRWFIALLILNTFAILDIFYIFYIAKKTPQDLKHLFKAKI